ncbi:hypothetical protein HYU23_03035, partial [Candidatus Woesearchaeota archaeon]|nr:hypothetical protein [Candidatus Woesearchaeota archaeon]
KTGCQVETLDFVSGVQSKANELYSLSYGSSFECTLVRAAGQSESRCEFVMPNNLNGFCFVDTTKSFNPDDIKFQDVRTLVVGLGKSANKNLFFSTSKGDSCKADPVLVRRITTNGAVCLSIKDKIPSFVMENKGNLVEVKKP